jgi:hypothetical protein
LVESLAVEVSVGFALKSRMAMQIKANGHKL